MLYIGMKTKNQEVTKTQPENQIELLYKYSEHISRYGDEEMKRCLDTLHHLVLSQIKNWDSKFLEPIVHADCGFTRVKYDHFLYHVRFILSGEGRFLIRNIESDDLREDFEYFTGGYDKIGPYIIMDKELHFSESHTDFVALFERVDPPFYSYVLRFEVTPSGIRAIGSPVYQPADSS